MSADTTIPCRFDVTMLILRLVHIGIALSLGAFSIFFFRGSDFAQHIGFSSHSDRWLATAAAAVSYLAVGILAIRDIRASRMLAILLCLISTPLFALLWLFSQWSTQGSEAARPLVYYVGGNIILIHAAIWVIMRAARNRRWLATR